jgi:hypothetical protein
LTNTVSIPDPQFRLIQTFFKVFEGETFQALWENYAANARLRRRGAAGERQPGRCSRGMPEAAFVRRCDCEYFGL